MTFSAIYWNPPREAFNIPFIDHPVVWYGILFVTGLTAGYFVLLNLLTRQMAASGFADPKGHAVYLVDRLTWFTVAGTIIGARLGHVLFYEPQRYLNNPIEILQTWKGGLASHGAIIGILIALYLFSRTAARRYPNLSFIRILDLIAIPAAIAGCFIRLGNFVNQEILGTPTNVPWAVLFGNPADGSAPIPRHPVVLYEAAAYLFIFIFLYTLKIRAGRALRAGQIAGLLLITVNVSRFILEFWKAAQFGIMQDHYLQTGQYLSLPFLLLGILLFFFGERFDHSYTKS